MVDDLEHELTKNRFNMIRIIGFLSAAEQVDPSAVRELFAACL